MAVSENLAPLLDPGAELAILSAILLNPACLDDVLDIVQPSDLSGAHEIMLRGMVQLDASGVPIDTVTLSRHLRADDRLESVGGAPALFAAIDASPAIGNVLDHARIVADLARQRRIVAVARRIAAEGRSPLAEPLADWIRRVEADFGAATELETAVDGPESLDIVAATVVRDAGERMAREDDQDRMVGQPCGLFTLDRKLSGWEPGPYVLAGRPGMGKSALAMTIAKGLAERSNKLSVFVSLEMPKSQLALRALCSEAKVPVESVRRGDITDSQHTALTAAAGSLTRLPLSLAFRPGATVREVRGLVRRALRDQRRKLNRPDLELGFVAVDYIQIATGDKSGNREGEVASISRALMNLAGELGVPVLALSQLNREVEKREDKRPKLSDLRESGAIEQDAAAILFVYRDEHYHPKTARAGVAELIVAKNRNGAAGTIELMFRPEFVRFEQILDDDRFDYLDQLDQ